MIVVVVEPRRIETHEKVGPGTYDTNLDSVHKKLPNLTIIQKKQPHKPVPKKALESFIDTIFSSDTSRLMGAHDTSFTDRELTRERSGSHLRNKNLRLGKAMFIPKTEQGSPRTKSRTEGDGGFDPFNKPNSIFVSKTKRTNLIDEK